MIAPVEPLKSPLKPESLREMEEGIRSLIFEAISNNAANLFPLMDAWNSLLDRAQQLGFLDENGQWRSQLNPVNPA